MNRRRLTAANPYLPAETNPFGQQENPFVPTNETIEQGIAPTEPEGPRVVTGPDTPQTAKPRGEVVTVDASLDRLKVAVACEACGQRGLLRLGQVSDSTRCRCGSARVELLEASRRTAEKECTCWEGYERVPGTEPCASGSCRKKTSLRSAANKVYKVEVWGYEDYEELDSLVANEDTYTDYTVIVAAPDAETARWTAIEYSDGAGLIDPDAQVLEDLTGSSVRIDITAGSKPKKRVLRVASDSWVYTGTGDFGDTPGLPTGYRGSFFFRLFGDSSGFRGIVWEVGSGWGWRLLKDEGWMVTTLAEGVSSNAEDAKAFVTSEAQSRGLSIKTSRRRTASGWMKSLNPHHHYKTVVKNGYELNLFASDVDYRWTVDAMVTGDSSTLELFEQGIGTSLEDAKRQAEQSAQFFQG